MDKNESKFPEDLVNVRVQANTSYQIKRVMELVETEKGLEMMSCSKILKNTGTGPRLRQFATFKDLKHEEKEQERKNKQTLYRQVLPPYRVQTVGRFFICHLKQETSKMGAYIHAFNGRPWNTE